MTLTEIERPQISGGCPYKVLNSQWVPTRPEAMMKNDQKWTWQRYIKPQMTHVHICMDCCYIQIALE